MTSASLLAASKMNKLQVSYACGAVLLLTGPGVALSELVTNTVTIVFSLCRSISDIVRTLSSVSLTNRCS